MRFLVLSAFFAGIASVSAAPAQQEREITSRGSGSFNIEGTPNRVVFQRAGYTGWTPEARTVKGNFRLRHGTVFADCYTSGDTGDFPYAVKFDWDDVKGFKMSNCGCEGTGNSAGRIVCHYAGTNNGLWCPSRWATKGDNC